MIAEPYICRQGPRTGYIAWFDADPDAGEAVAQHHLYTRAKALDGNRRKTDGLWQLYADFEREKLWAVAPERALCVIGCAGFRILAVRRSGRWNDPRQVEYKSNKLIGYDYEDWQKDSESSRLLKRAEFLKAVCEKEGVEWLPAKAVRVWSEDGSHAVANGANSPTMDLGDMKPGDTRDLLHDGKKIGTVTLNVGSVDVRYEPPARDCEGTLAQRFDSLYSWVDAIDSRLRVFERERNARMFPHSKPSSEPKA